MGHIITLYGYSQDEFKQNGAQVRSTPWRVWNDNGCNSWLLVNGSDSFLITGI